MICQIRGKLIKKEENRVIIDKDGLFYEINIPRTVFLRLNSDKQDAVELVIYYYFNIDRNRGIPVMIGFTDELEKDFFEKFIGVSGVGPKAALRAFDKPMSVIARAIEEGDMAFLQTLAGVGKQRARQIIAHLQGKVGRFTLIKEGEQKELPIRKEIVEEAKGILRRLQYNTRESEGMIEKALEGRPQVDSVEELLNEIYRQRR